ncbi:Lrp/AsnC family transcriptional regulator [Novosphingobium huizhouense]|uniref:Lrp/AsnC family transcriptional regulator n=1 Tax=Novosphingobium huizhouense TaxID=2866625 RepID=UPI001CD9169E|nr:Lrp/AsnC family transcriptional regulator [Novosphingobium huizhouense]
MLTQRDLAILDVLQKDSDTSLSKIGEKVHLSPSACSRRIANLRDEGYIRRNVAVLDRDRLGLGTTVFVTVSARIHSAEWTANFRRAVEAIPEIVEVYRLTGSVDYLLKIVLPSVNDYDKVYNAIVARVEMNVVHASIVMEDIKHAGLPLSFVPHASSR